MVQTPSEPKTGGDFDLAIVQPASGDAVQFRIQAKRLTPHKYDWKIGSYAELAHPHNSGTQSQTLMRAIRREAIDTIPLYAFYNPAHVCSAAGNTISGVELASGWEIRERIKAFVKAKPKRLPFKRIGSLQPFFFPLSTILCASGDSVSRSAIPLPHEARSAVEVAIEARAEAAGVYRTLAVPEAKDASLLAGDADGSLKAHSQTGQPRTTRSVKRDALPAAIRAAVERRGERIVTAKVKRPRIILIADRIAR